MPAVREGSGTPDALELVEVAPGDVRKLNAKDKAAILGGGSPAAPAAKPEKLERVEVRPGVVLKLNARDRQAMAAQAKSDEHLASLNTKRAAGEVSVAAPASPEVAPPDAVAEVSVAAAELAEPAAVAAQAEAPTSAEPAVAAPAPAGPKTSRTRKPSASKSKSAKK